MRAAKRVKVTSSADTAVVKEEVMSFPYLKRDLTKTLALTMLALGVEAALWLFLKK